MKIVFTEHANLPNDKINCEYCGQTISGLINGEYFPNLKECYKNGNVPVPNFGWLCSQKCADKFEKDNDINFMRNQDGKIDYYNGNLE